MPKLKALTKEDIVAVSDITIEEVKVPEWGGIICLKEMNGLGRDTFEKTVSARTGKSEAFDITGLRTLLLSLVICDAEGNLLFTEADVEALNKKSAKVTSRLFVQAQKMNNIGDEALEQAAKN